MTSVLQTRAFVATLEALAADVGRLRRRFASNEAAWTGPFVVDRIALLVDGLDAQLQPTAGELYRERIADGLDDGRAVASALGVVDARARRMRELLREPAR